jgi:hypothetical protein
VGGGNVIIRRGCEGEDIPGAGLFVPGLGGRVEHARRERRHPGFEGPGTGGHFSVAKGGELA